MNDYERVVLDAVSEALTELGVIAHTPVHGEAMHKVVTGHVFDRLEENGYTIVPKGANEEER